MRHRREGWLHLWLRFLHWRVIHSHSRIVRIKKNGIVFCNRCGKRFYGFV